MNERDNKYGCGCDAGCGRRDFLTAVSTAVGGLAFTAVTADAAQEEAAAQGAEKEKAAVRAAFLYPPSATFANNPDGWWSWPGNDFDAEARQQQYTTALREMEDKVGVKVTADPQPVGSMGEAQRLAEQLKANPPDGLLLAMFYNRSLGQADLLLKTAEELGVPVVFFIGLGVKHGSVAQYRRPGVYFIQSLDNLEAIEYGLRMIGAKKRMAQSRLLSITEAKEPREGVEPFLGTTVRVIPYTRYAEVFEQVPIDAAARQLINKIAGGATEIRNVSSEAFEHAARAHLALKQLLAEENADGLTMNCLRRGMLKPCISFSMLNGDLIPATCENDFQAMYSQMLGQLLTGRPGFQVNPCFETERNHFYGSHCTCPTKVYGPDGPELPYLLRRFAHSNEGSCAIQVFWKEGDPLTMVHYYPGTPPSLDVYAGRVYKSHPMPPAAGCTTNVEFEVTDRDDVCLVKGHHNVVFCGDFARKFRLFAQLYKMELADTGFRGPVA